MLILVSETANFFAVVAVCNHASRGVKCLFEISLRNYSLVGWLILRQCKISPVSNCEVKQILLNSKPSTNGFVTSCSDFSLSV